MKSHIQTMITLLTNKDFKALLAHYMQSSELENIDQLAFTFQQGQKSLSVFEFYQQIATKFIESKGLPELLISQINTSDALSFFTPALQISENFNKTNLQKRNVFHYLLAGKKQTDTLNIPPFNYLRSMMLFESNETLSAALLQRDCKNLTPVEAYFFANANLLTLPNHELTALLALIEIETKQQVIDFKNYPNIIKAVKGLCDKQKLSIDDTLQRTLLIATYYGKPTSQVGNDLAFL
ncbi:hypothetical protein [Pseudoalteromonas denitrificans]|uniref:Uncharacterized protein n=1 Tax=Pseudoalteromonas denitrificans DSM 6059 TaxID=1123010 RepID=A0A1I1J230_9GAMM|nr:hypothetical protein [Pseudoalteromonas denitrificans]SFC42659.1 hypothetical protein SAMN02745724_01629 [Pseudoalteromonas denitrificans DSM 6059]